MSSALWNVETLGAAVNAITGSDTASVSWADATGATVSRRSSSRSGRRRPPLLAVGVCVRDDDAEARIRELPGFVRLSVREDTDPLDDEPVRVLRAVFTGSAS